MVRVSDSVEVGFTYECHAVGIKNIVVGVVEQLYGNTVMINVLRCHQSDRAAVIERQNKLLVRYKNVYTCGEAAEGQACF
ncbi:hypothetical protein [Enterococcus sp. AZ048]|uniref:hypothetical protein n=1 Tax=Enterococcus sp. AZ048 TaxID=2774658 RepID=UPI003F68FA77